MRTPARLLTAVAALGLVLGACGEDEAQEPTTTTSPVVVEGSVAPQDPTTEDSSADTGGIVTEGGSDEDAEATTIEVSYVGGAIGNGGRHDVPVGASVRLVVTADVTDEIHVHGYELEAVVTPEQPAVFEFVVDIPGVFEVELHEAGIPLIEFAVS